MEQFLFSIFEYVWNIFPSVVCKSEKKILWPLFEKSCFQKSIFRNQLNYTANFSSIISWQKTNKQTNQNKKPEQTNKQPN